MNVRHRWLRLGSAAFVVLTTAAAFARVDAGGGGGAKKPPPPPPPPTQVKPHPTTVPTHAPTNAPTHAPTNNAPHTGSGSGSGSSGSVPNGGNNTGHEHDSRGSGSVSNGGGNNAGHDHDNNNNASHSGSLSNVSGKPCSCDGGVEDTGRKIPASETHCGYEVCGMDQHVYSCGQTGWTNTGAGCGHRTTATTLRPMHTDPGGADAGATACSIDDKVAHHSGATCLDWNHLCTAKGVRIACKNRCAARVGPSTGDDWCDPTDPRPLSASGLPIANGFLLWASSDHTNMDVDAIDVAAPYNGSRNVQAIRAGTVMYSGEPNENAKGEKGSSYGPQIVVVWTESVLGDSYTLYAHLQQTSAKHGMKLNVGDAIGIATPDLVNNSTRPHVHIAIHVPKFENNASLHALAYQVTSGQEVNKDSRVNHFLVYTSAYHFGLCGAATAWTVRNNAQIFPVAKETAPATSPADGCP